MESYKCRYFKVFGDGKSVLTFLTLHHNSLDDLVERIEISLDMFPVDLSFSVFLLSKDEVIKKYKELYNRDVDYIAFSSKRERSVFLSTEHLTLSVLTHEIAHTIINQYFTEIVPRQWHELLAQYAEKEMR